MTKTGFQEWYNNHQGMKYTTSELSAMSYKRNYEDGDIYKCLYTVHPGYILSRYFEPMMSDYTCKCYVNELQILQ